MVTLAQKQRYNELIKILQDLTTHAMDTDNYSEDQREHLQKAVFTILPIIKDNRNV